MALTTNNLLRMFLFYFLLKVRFWNSQIKLFKRFNQLAKLKIICSATKIGIGLTKGSHKHNKEKSKIFFVLLGGLKEATSLIAT